MHLYDSVSLVWQQVALWTSCPSPCMSVWLSTGPAMLAPVGAPPAPDSSSATESALGEKLRCGSWGVNKLPRSPRRALAPTG